MADAKSNPDIVAFHRIYTGALPLLKADASALSTLPTAAFQYCEPVRTASAFGWYVFPPIDFSLRWDGADVFVSIDGETSELTSRHLSPQFLAYWDQFAPPDQRGRAPPVLTSTFIPGMVQIWSGFLASTAPGWSLLVGPLTNLTQSLGYSCYEAIVETDSFKPWPMFINIKLLTTDRELRFSKMRPLFQVRPLRRESYAEDALRYNERIGLEPRLGGKGSMTEQDWTGYGRTVRSVLADRTTEDRPIGSYGAGLRRRRKQAEEGDNG